MQTNIPSLSVPMIASICSYKGFKRESNFSEAIAQFLAREICSKTTLSHWRVYARWAASHGIDCLSYALDALADFARNSCRMDLRRATSSTFSRQSTRHSQWLLMWICTPQCILLFATSSLSIRRDSQSTTLKNRQSNGNGDTSFRCLSTDHIGSQSRQ
jgi:hypothetical protein